MSVYAIGDLQGCLEPLKRLLDAIKFDDADDTLWFVGDLVNRGPHSLETLRFVRNLGKSAITVLGNHDLHLLAVANGFREVSAKDTLTDILVASDRPELLDWLRRQPLVHYDSTLNYLMSHAGIPPNMSLVTALALGQEISDALSEPEYTDFLANMYGNEPARWKKKLTGYDRLRFGVNAFTRMRYLTEDGELDFSCNGPPAVAPDSLTPWFGVPDRDTQHIRVVFGHWSSLGNKRAPNVFPLDFGCVWGGALAAMNLETQVVTKVFAD